MGYLSREAGRILTSQKHYQERREDPRDMAVQGMSVQTDNARAVKNSFTTRGEKRTVLLVDDDELVRKVVGIQLSYLGFRVLTAENGMDGLRVFRGNASDISLVLLDHKMPVMDGMTLLPFLRRIKPGISVILISGSIEELELDKTLEKPDCFVRKPFEFEELQDHIRNILSTIEKQECD